MRPSSGPMELSASSSSWAPSWTGCYDNAEWGMRSAEWLGEVDRTGHRRVRAGPDLPMKFRIPQSALRIRLRPPARRRTLSALRRRSGEGVEPVAGGFGHHRRLRCAVRRAAAGSPGAAPGAHLADDLAARVAAARRGVRHYG